MVEIKNFKTLLDTLKEEELDNPELINGPGICNCNIFYKVFVILLIFIRYQQEKE
jgi:hypothetical protein